MIINGRRGSCSYLIKHVPDVGLWFSKPHGEHLGSFDGHKVCLALVGDGLGQQGLPTARRAIEQHSTRRSHTKLKELVRIFDRVLRRARGALMDYWWHLCLQVHAESRECLSVSSTWTSSCSSLLTSSSPPMSSQLTWGTSAQVSLRADGLLWLSAHWGKAWWGQGKEALFFEGLIEYSLEKAKVCLCVFVCVCVCVYLEVVHGDGQWVEQVGVDGFVLQVYEDHLLADGLQSSFWAQSSQVGTYVTVGLCGDLRNVKYLRDIDMNLLNSTAVSFRTFLRQN